jgi:signal transduction histidine kinase/CheY-like chemotaxis protein
MGLAAQRHRNPIRVKIVPKRIISTLFMTMLIALVWLSATAWLGYRSVEAEFRYHVPENTIWAAAQTEIELGRFLLVIEPIANGAPVRDAKAIEQQFNIFWSRADLYRHGTLFDHIKSDPLLKEQATGVLNALNQVDPLISKIVGGDASAARHASSLLVPFVKSFRKLTVASLNADRLERERLVYAQSSAERILNQSAFATAALVLILLLYLLYSERQATSLLVKSRESEIALAQQADQMEVLAAKARKGSEAKSDFLAMMSHDLRTPMNAIIGYNDILSETKLDDDQKSYIAAIMLACDNMLGLINDILDLRRLESGKIELRNAAFAPRDLLNSVARVIKIIAENNGNRVDVTVDNGLSEHLMGDAERLTQVLTNLAGNAAKFTRGGNITITACLGEAKNAVRYLVSDTGNGIPEEMRSRLFKPFEQGDDGRADGRNSSGLGLAISDRIVRSLGGEIICDTAEGKGTTFYFDLPYVPTEKAKASNEMTKADNDVRLLAGRRALIADDTSANLLVATAILENAGMICTPVSDGTSAIKCAENENFDIMFIDIQMPDMSGIQVASAIRLMNGKRSTTPLVALTAQSFQRDRERALAGGFDAFLSKPIRASDLQNMVTNAKSGSLAIRRSTKRAT